MKDTEIARLDIGGDIAKINHISFGQQYDKELILYGDKLVLEYKYRDYCIEFRFGEIEKIEFEHGIPFFVPNKINIILTRKAYEGLIRLLQEDEAPWCL